MIGIYKITNKINNKIYIGQSKDIERRWKKHINNSKTKAITIHNIHSKRSLTFSFIVYSTSCFIIFN